MNVTAILVATAEIMADLEKGLRWGADPEEVQRVRDAMVAINGLFDAARASVSETASGKAARKAQRKGLRAALVACGVTP